MINHILIEGANHCGKTTTTTLLKQLMPGTTVVELHDFYHQHILRQFSSLQSLATVNDFKNLNSRSIPKVEQYLINRTKAVLQIFNSLKFDDIIIERLMLTQVAYSKLLFDLDLTDYLLHIEERLVQNDVLLIYVTANPHTIIERMRYETTKNIYRKGKGIPFHLIDEQTAVKKNELYYHFYSKLNRIKKIKINTSKTDKDKVVEQLKTILCR